MEAFLAHLSTELGFVGMYAAAVTAAAVSLYRQLQEMHRENRKNDLANFKQLYDALQIINKLGERIGRE